MLRPASVCVAALLLSLTASGQIYIPDSNGGSGGCNVVPFGYTATSSTWANQKYQVMVTQAQLGNASTLEICDLAFSACGTGIKHFDTIEIRCSQTNASVMSRYFASNVVANVKTVLKASNLEWHHTANIFHRIGFDQSYNYVAALGKNVVFEIQITGSRGLVSSTRNGHRVGTTLQRVFAYGWTTKPPAKGLTDTGSTHSGLKMEIVTQRSDLQAFGMGCKGSAGVPTLTFPSGATAKLGGSLAINCINCPKKTPVLHVFGLTRYHPGIDLGIIGAAGCKLYQTTDIVLGGISDTAGVYSFKATIPKDNKLVCFRFFTQMFPFDASANGWSRTASNYARILPGVN